MEYPRGARFTPAKLVLCQSNFNGAGRSKDCRNDLARNAFIRSPHAHHSDEVHFERKFAHDGRPRLSNNRSHLFNPLVIRRSAIAYLELSVVFSPNHLAQPLTPYPLPTKDGGVLRTIGDARAYMLALPKEREWLDHWKAAYRLLVRGANAAELTRQVHLALSVDGEFDSEAFENLSASRQWRPGTADT
jgi:hypothetical protein